MKNAKHQTGYELSDTQKPLPQFSGANHPTQVNQVQRKLPRWPYHSDNAIRVLESFQAKTGIKCEILYPPRNILKFNASDRV